MANDTTTQLNLGTGGDVMDETLVTQSDGVTAAKRPRVVIGGDANTGGSDLVQPTKTDPGANTSALPTIPVALVNDTPEVYVGGETRPLSLTPEGRLRVASVQASVDLDFFGDDAREASAGSTNPDDFRYCSDNPFGI